MYSEYQKKVLPKVRREIQELQQEVDPQWAKERRIAYLQQQERALLPHIRFNEVQYSAANRNEKKWIRRRLVALYKEHERLKEHIRRAGTPLKGAITPEQVSRAKGYPISELVDIRGGKALCPFHDDHHPSMGIKNNRYRCFACGEAGDTISLLMKREGLDFIKAVKRLQ
jgi:hypothetical protein